MVSVYSFKLNTSSLNSVIWIILFSETAVGCTASYFVKIIWCSCWFWTPPPILRLNIAYFAVAEGWLLLDIGWFVLFFQRFGRFITSSQSSTLHSVISVSIYFLISSFPLLDNKERHSRNAINISLHLTISTCPCHLKLYVLSYGNSSTHRLPSLLARNQRPTSLIDAFPVMSPLM